MEPSTRLTIVALLAFATASCVAAAQSDNADKTGPKTKVTELETVEVSPQPMAYNLTLSIKESDSGKVAVEKSYTLTILSDDPRYGYTNVRDGDKIPYMSDKGRQWVDVGTNVDVTECKRHGNVLSLKLAVSSSALVAKTNGVDLPQVNQWSIAIIASLAPGKPSVVYSTTDATSGRKVEIQATATWLGGR